MHAVGAGHGPCCRGGVRRLPCVVLGLALPGCFLVAPFSTPLDPAEAGDPGSPGSDPDTTGIDTGDLGRADPDAGPAIEPPSCTIEAQEICGNSTDDDCDGQVDEGCVCTDPETRDCWSGPPGSDGVGVCARGQQSCADGSWGACEGAVLPGDEVCDNDLDDDCDGEVDEDCEAPPTGCTDGDTRDCGTCGSQECRGGAWTDCIDSCQFCYSCSTINAGTDFAACGIGSVPAGADGTCPAGSSHDIPNCEPCWDCSFTSAFCESGDCCGDFSSTGVVGAGCTCFGCTGSGHSAQEVDAAGAARTASTDSCPWPAAPYETECAGYVACRIGSCGPVGTCGGRG
jgi:hypothetical protein